MATSRRNRRTQVTVRPVSRPRRRGRRRGYLYEFCGWDPHALLKGKLKTIVLYVGQTRQRPEVRRLQHEHGTPNGEPPKIWYPLVTSFEVTNDWRAIGNWWLDIREAWRIACRKPVANILLNKKYNRKRIPPWEMDTLMQSINGMGGVPVLVARARATNRRGFIAGWTFHDDGSVTRRGNTDHYENAGRL